MTIRTAYSTKSAPNEAAADIQQQFGDLKPKAVLFFASSHLSPEQIGGAVQSTFPGAQTLGCTTSGEIVSGKMLKDSIVAMAFDQESLTDLCIEVVENISQEDNVPKAIQAFEQHLDQRATDWDFQKYVGLVLIDGLTLAEERINDSIGNLTNVYFIGGSAGDDLAFKATHVFANGKCYANAAILALLKPATPFGIIKTQSFCAKDQVLTATKVNEATREVIEFNGKPAARAYAEMVGGTVETASNYFQRNPVGLMVDDEPFVRSPQQIKGESMVFYCNILEGMDLSVLESTDIVADTRKAVATKAEELGGLSGIINFHCILRTLELEQKNLTGPYGEVFSDVPTIGFSTYGESLIGHVNQTSTMLVFH